MKKALVIGGSDPSSGAGIQIDLHTLNSIGVFGYSAISALTIQNSISVRSFYPMQSEVLREQVEAILDDSADIDAVKIGMLGSKENIKVVCSLIEKYNLKNIVLDPIISPTNGPFFLKEDSIKILVHKLIPLSTVVTPNIFEAEQISGMKISKIDQMKKAAAAVYTLGPKWVLIKGSHLRSLTRQAATNGDKICDILYNGLQYYEYFYEMLLDYDVRGTGCILSSALAGYLALQDSVVHATKLARQYTLERIEHAKKVGKGRPQAL